MTQSKRKKEKDAPSKSAGGGARKPKMSTYKPRKESIDIMEIIKETILEEWAKIDETKLCARGKAAAKAKYDVYPSAYANGYAVQVCKGTKPGLDGKKRAASGYSKNEGTDEGCGCGTCDGCGDKHGEGGMAQNQLSVLSKNAAELTQMFSEQSDLPEWVESKITKAADYINMVKNYMEGEAMQGQSMMEDVSEGTRYHLVTKTPFTENIYRVGSEEYFNLYREVRSLYQEGKLELNEEEQAVIETDIGEYDIFEGETVPLDFPMYDMSEELTEEKDPPIGKPMKNSGSGKKYKVYVRNPSTGNVKKITYGDSKGGLKGNWNNPEARKSFAARHNCEDKKDRTKSGYWACRAHKDFGKDVPGRFW